MKKREGISFAEKVKEESARSERDDEEKRSLLSSFMRLNGYLCLREGNEPIIVVLLLNSLFIRSIRFVVSILRCCN